LIAIVVGKLGIRQTLIPTSSILQKTLIPTLLQSDLLFQSEHQSEDDK
jgi:hypothetical protein